MDDLWDLYVDITPKRESLKARRSAQNGLLSIFVKPLRLGIFDRLNAALAAFSPSERLVLYILSSTLALTTLVLLSSVNALVSVTVPVAGGVLTEGEIGPARFINPLITLSQPDQDLSALVYSGLMRAMPDGSFVPDLAQNYTVSNDGRTYTFTIRPNALFQDGAPVTSDDVAFTIQKALDPTIGSAHRADWTGVQVSTPDARTVVFTLPHAYAPFMEDATLGILPKHLWKKVSAEEFAFSPLNTHPIGSGPYRISTIVTDATGAASRYELSAFDKYALDQPFLSHIVFVFYPDNTALMQGLNKREINAVAALPADDVANIHRTDLLLSQAALPRVFGIFFNQSHNSVLADDGVRQALDAVLDKQSLVQNTLEGRAQILSGPIPSGTLNDSHPATPQPIALNATTSQLSINLDEARGILTKAGWVLHEATSSAETTWKKNKQTLTFTLATANQPELIATAKAIVSVWKQLGVQVTLQIYPLADLNTGVIRPRNYDALLFGEVVGPELDLYAFWHSSQRNDPGLNLALYANTKTDALLNQARGTADPALREALYTQFQTLLLNDHPAVFLYAPDFLYVSPAALKGVQIGSLATPSDRFENITAWYMSTESIWKIFSSNRY